MKYDDFFERCIEEGQGSCEICIENKKYNRTWMVFLSKNKVDNKLYCSGCVRKYLMEENRDE